MKNKPDTKRGFVQIACGDSENDILYALACSKLGGTELSVCLIVIRKTWGWKKKEDWISLTQFEKLTQRGRQTVVDAINSLVRKNILVRKTVIAVKTTYKFNKDFSSWNTKLVRNTRLVQKTVTTSPENRAELVRKTGHTKETITKETIQKKLPPNSKNSLTACTEEELETIAGNLNVSINYVDDIHSEILNKIEDGVFQEKKYGKTVYYTLSNWVRRRIKDDIIKLKGENQHANQTRAIDATKLL